jgi:hypothetical protein
MPKPEISLFGLFKSYNSARLFAAAENLHQSIGYMLETTERLDYKLFLNLTRNGLTPSAFAAA